MSESNPAPGRRQRPGPRHGDPRPDADRVVRGLRAVANESEGYLGAAGRDGAMHRTDLTALAHVMQGEVSLDGPVTPGRLRDALQLSAPATTAVVDRLERLGHVERRPHPDDRRSVVVVPTALAYEVGGAMFARIAARMGPVLAARSDDELAVIASFLEDAAAATHQARRDITET